MPIYRLCPRCNSQYEYGTKCPNGCQDKLKTKSNKVYDKFQRKNQRLYTSKEWITLRKVCRNRFDGLCIWNYMKHKRITPGTISHHIVEVNENSRRSLDLNNLIYVSDEAHREIHELYKDNKQATQRELFEMINKWRNRKG